MRIREFRKADVPQLRRIHKERGYCFKFPETKELVAKFTVEADDGRVVGFAGAERIAQIVGVFDAEWGSPHQRLEAIRMLHEPVQKALRKKGIKGYYIWLDPKWPKFAKRLVRFGWAEAVWRCFFKESE